LLACLLEGQLGQGGKCLISINPDHLASRLSEFVGVPYVLKGMTNIKWLKKVDCRWCHLAIGINRYFWGGSYAANNASGLKKLIEQALALLEILQVNV